MVNPSITFGDLQVVAWSAHFAHVFVLRHRAAQHNPCFNGEIHEDGVEHIAAHVVPKDIDAIGHHLGQFRRHITGLVVDSRVETQFIDEELTLFGSTGDANHASRPKQSGHLTRQ